MAHYAFLDDNTVVTEVITGIHETETIEGLDTETWYGNFRGQTCKRTSYNTRAGQNAISGIAFRKNYAGIGYVYDSIRDAFIPPKPYPSWILHEETCLWDSPIQYPNDGKLYTWDEETISWKEQINDPN